MTKLRNILATLTALALTAGLATATLAADEPEVVGHRGIEGKTWSLTAQVIDGAMTPVPGRAQVSLRMEDGRAGGNGGCNSYFTSYELDGDQLTFGQIGSTLIACAGPASAIESAYLANLGLVAGYQTGDDLTAMTDVDGDLLLEFELAPEVGVVGSWVAQGINNGAGGVVSGAITSMVSAEFSADGDLTGNDGCNDYFTTYEIDGDAIAISEMIGSTRMACASDELAEQSQQYYAALVAASTWAVDTSGSLELRDAGGATQVQYLPAE